MKRRTQEAWAPWVAMGLIILAWQAVCSAFNVSVFIFPSPARIAEQLFEFRGEIARHAWHTFLVTMAGFGLAIVVGVMLGFLVGSSRIAYAALYPLMTAFNALPKAAFVPILVVVAREEPVSDTVMRPGRGYPRSPPQRAAARPGGPN